MRNSFRRFLSPIVASSRLATAPLRCVPDFIIIGAQRSGSSTLYKSLVKHANVLAGAYKEVHYFDNNYWRGERWYRSHFPLAALKQLIQRTTGRPMITGEGSPYYLFHPAVPQRIHQVLPHIRSIALLRNPVDRAYSHYNSMIHRGHEELTFEEAIRAEAYRLRDIRDDLFQDPTFRSTSHQRFSYLSRGRYAEQLERWFQWFPREQILILQSEALFNNPKAGLLRIFEFLELPSQSTFHLKIANRGNYSPMEKKTRTQLLTYFEPYNLELFNLLGQEFDWS